MLSSTFGGEAGTESLAVCSHPPYSPDRPLCDSWFFPKAKIPTRGKCLESAQDTTAATTAQLQTFKKEAFQKGCRKGWEWWVSARAEGSYLSRIEEFVTFTVVNI